MLAWLLCSRSPLEEELELSFEEIVDTGTGEGRRGILGGRRCMCRLTEEGMVVAQMRASRKS